MPADPATLKRSAGALDMSDVIIVLLIIVVVFGGMGALIWKVFFVAEPMAVASVDFDGSTLRARNQEGVVRWTHQWPAATRSGTAIVLRSYGRQAGSSGPVRSDLPAPGEGILHRLWSLPRLPKQEDEVIAVADFDDPAAPGRVVAFDQSGSQLWQVTYPDLMGPVGERFGLTWSFERWLVYSVAGERKILLVFKHDTEWPWVAALLDDRGGVIGRFVNAGPIGQVDLVTTPSRILLALAGTSASEDAGMLALVDALEPSGTSPEAAGSRYACTGCAPGAPFRYFVFPRSEVNVASGAPVNEATYGREPRPRQIQQKGLAVYTAETADDREHNLTAEGIDHALSATYIFDYGLEKLWRTSVNDDYWAAHRAFEAKGRIRHTRDRCPERDGPPLVRVWDATNGWQELRPREP